MVEVKSALSFEDMGRNASFESYSRVAPSLSEAYGQIAEGFCEEEPGGAIWPWKLPCSSSVSGNVFLMLAFGYILTVAAQMIGEGSELLLEVLNPGLVGGLLLPLLGAFPDALIIASSGLKGTPEEAQETVAVGLGVLAGSTVMLLTVAWGGSLIAGRCDLNEKGTAVERTLTKPFGETGITTDEQTKVGALIMALSALPLLIVQIPLLDGHPAEGPEAALIGASICAVGLVSYGAYQVANPWLQEKKIKEARLKLARARAARQLGLSARSWGGLVNPATGAVRQDSVDRFFDLFDKDNSGSLERTELQALIVSMGTEHTGVMPSKEEVDIWMREFDKNDDQIISREEFATGMQTWIQKMDGELSQRQLALAGSGAQWDGGSAVALASGELSQLLQDEEQEEEEEEGGEPLTKPQIVKKASGLLLAGAALVATFADPAVSSISNFAEAAHIDPFVVAFVAAPFASNASEVISSFRFALKKRKRNISLTYAQIYGAITMNNTLCLGLFLGIVYLRGLTWDFSAEVTAMVTVTWILAAVGQRSTFPALTAVPVLALYPLSLLGVEFLESTLGWK